MKKVETSKLLTWIVTSLFIISYIFTNVAFMIWNKDITFIFQYVFYAFNVCLVAYVGKAGLENITKINVSDMFKKKVETEIINQTVNNSGGEENNG